MLARAELSVRFADSTVFPMLTSMASPMSGEQGRGGEAIASRDPTPRAGLWFCPYRYLERLSAPDLNGCIQSVQSVSLEDWGQSSPLVGQCAFLGSPN